MPEYLSKEEVRQWRSSLEKITLEEFARRLGKVINEEKDTNDVVDKVMKDIKFDDDALKPEYQTRSEKIMGIAQAAIKREREIVNTIVKPKTTNKNIENKTIDEIAKEILPQPKEEVKKSAKIETKSVKPKQTVNAKKVEQTSEDDFPVMLNKAFTAREQVVFDHLLAHKNTVVFAKDLAELLGLPRDYIYKYIKGIRAKMKEDILSNAQKGGFVLKV